MRIEGLIIGMIAFGVIGIFHPVVIKAEYYFTEKIWPLFLIAGILMLAMSCFVRNSILSASFGIVGCTCLWSILELKHQTQRVEKGWFPRNPKRVSRK